MKRWLIAGSMLIAACGQADENPQELPRRNVVLKGVELNVQVADSMDERAKGLMFVKSMPTNDGMLFIWPEAEPRSFWMRNTYIPLDLLYVHGGKIVSIVQGAKPLDETALPSVAPADMVLEVNAGWVARNHVAVGDTLELK